MAKAAEPAPEAEAKPEKSGNTLVVVLLIVVILLLIGVLAVGVMFLMKPAGGAEGKDQAAAHEAPAEHGAEAAGDHAAADTHAKAYSPKYKQYEPPMENAQPQYFEMKFVTGFKGEGKAKFLAVDLKFMTYYPQLVADLEIYRPEIDNNLITLLRVQTYTELSKDDGPELLRNAILSSVKATLEKRKIYPDLLEDVYLTRFVMQ